MAKYEVIYVDPPWPYASRNTNKATRFGGGVHGHYDVMTEAELKAMKPYIESISAENCAMFMWATGPRMDMAIELGKHWGFRYATKAFTWIKVAKTVKLEQDVALTSGVVLPKGTRVPFRMLNERTAMAITTIVGPGNYSGSNAEDVLLFVKGSVKAVEKLVPQVILHPRMRHSHKPDVTRDRIVRMCGDVPRIELFAREQAPGWDASGLELDGTDYRNLSVLAAA